jgi:hypothetical protein
MLRAETPQEQFNLIGAGRRNLIINGDTASQDTDAPAGFSNSAKTVVTTAETGIGGGDERTSIEQRIEAQDLQMLNYGTSDAQGMTLSFWVKSNVTGKFSINVRAHDAGDAYAAPYYINSADTWEYKTVYIKGNTLSGGGITNDNGIGMWIRFMLIVSADQRSDSFTNKWVASSTASYGPTDMQSEWGLTVNDYFQITGVQLELGKVATPFEHRSYGEELALCQRYYYKHQRGAHSAYLGIAHCQSSTTAELVYFHPVPMRATPQMDSSATIRVKTADGTSGTSQNTTAITFDDPEQFAVSLGLTVTSGLVAGNAATVWLTGSADYIEGDAEL